MIDYNVEELVRKYVPFNHGVAGQGWNVVFCEFCGDGSRKKGPRGGWIFGDGGDSAGYHCFNCGCKETFSTLREYPFSKNMREVFDSFGIPKNEYNALLFKKERPKQNKENSVKTYSYTYLDIPIYFELLSESKSEDALEARKFLKSKYGLSPKDYSFYISKGPMDIFSSKQKAEAKTLKGRVIIPYFKSGKMIYYQARDFTGRAKDKYLSPSIPKGNIFFNIDQLYRHTDEPLYVTEGAQDAIHLKGVATMGNELTVAQKDMLSSSKRRKILVPDFNGDSSKLVEQFIDMGWSVAFPEYRRSCKDVSEAVVNYGRLYTAYDIVNNVRTAEQAELLYKFMNLS